MNNQAMNTTNIADLQALHGAAHTDLMRNADRLEALYQQESRGEITEGVAEDVREILLAERDSLSGLRDTLREAVHAAMRCPADDDEIVLVRGLNVNALQVAIDYCGEHFETEQGIVRMGVTFVEGTRAALEALASGAEEGAEDNWEERTNGWGEVSDAFREVILERKRAALAGAVAKVRRVIG